MNISVVSGVEGFHIQITQKKKHPKSNRPSELSTLENTLNFPVKWKHSYYHGGRPAPHHANYSVKKKKYWWHFEHSVSFAFQHNASTFYMTDSLNVENTSSDFNMIQHGFGGTECSKTAFLQMILSIFKEHAMKEKTWLLYPAGEVGCVWGRWTGHILCLPLCG